MPHFAPKKLATKQQVNYDSHTPRCAYCVNFRPPRIVLTTDSKTVRLQPLCKVMYGTVTENGLCDLWVSRKDGSTLDLT